MRTKPQNIKPIIFEFDTLLAVVKNSVGSKAFRNVYAEVGDKKTDILRDGDLSCAFFVSSVLTMLKLCKEIHCTVDSTVKDLLVSGWAVIKKPKVGSILVWEEKFSSGGKNKHIGFYIGKNQAVSNNTKLGSVAKHHWTFGKKGNKPKRKVELILWNEKL